MKENGSLVAFTLLAQAGVGLVLAALGLGASAALAGTALRVALALAGLGLAVAFAHLGRPFLAHRALCNLGSSWLSRECLGLAAFLALGAWAAFGGPAALGWLAAAAGCLGLFAMGALYGRAAFPAWKSAHTHVAFISAALALGGFTLAALAQGEPAGRSALVLAAAAVAAQLVEMAAHLAGLGGGGSAALASLRRLARPPLLAGLGLTAAGGLGYPVLAAFSGTAPAFPLAFAALAAGQILVRYAFFASGVHTMAAGWADLPAVERKRVLR